MNQVAKLKLIDVVQRLGLGYQFETEIKNALSSIYVARIDKFQNGDANGAQIEPENWPATHGQRLEF